ncbi:MAG: GDSL-type esterase/lipase family protein [Pseudomonadota bacterium]
MKRVLVYGDSLTWGYKPDESGRYGPEYRWPDVLEAELDGVEVLTEALCGRTTAYADDSSPADLNGARILPTVLQSHSPLDAVIFMLGTNDICDGRGVRQALRGLKRLVEIVRHQPTRIVSIRDAILLVAPPPLIAGIDPDLGEDLAEESRVLVGRIAELAEETGTAFFDASTVGTVSRVDGVHFDADLSRDIGLALVGPVRDLLA